MRNIFYGIFAVGLLLFLSSNSYANSTTNCKPSVHIQPVKGNYIPLLNGDIENLEKFLLELAEQNANYCKVSLRIDFKKGLETKQTITRGETRYNEKLFLEVQYFSPSYEAIIENAAGDLLHKIELGKELKSIEYSNAELKNHDALYTEWRRISKSNLSKIEREANNFQALIDFLKIENGISVPENPPLAKQKKKEILAPKGEVANVEKPEKSTRKSRRKARRKSKLKAKEAKKEQQEKIATQTPIVQKKSKAKIEKEILSKNQETKKEPQEKIANETRPVQKNNITKIEQEVASKAKETKKEPQEKIVDETLPVQKNSIAKIEQEVASKAKEAKKESQEKIVNETLPVQNNNNLEAEKESRSKAEVKEMAKSESKTNEKIVEKSETKSTKPEENTTPKVSNNQEKTSTKEEPPADLEKYSVPMTPTEIAKIEAKKSQESSKPREIISDDDMFEDVSIEEPLAGMILFQFPYGKNYIVTNESDFSIKINTGRESGKVFNKSSIKPKQEKKLKNKFKNGDWYSIVYPEKLHKKDIENYRESIESILSDLDLSDFKDDFFKMSEQLIPNLDIISKENPLTDFSQKDKIEVGFQKFIAEKGIEIFKENQQQEAENQLKGLLTLIVQSHRLHHYYKYTVGDSAAKRPVNKLPRFRKN